MMSHFGYMPWFGVGMVFGPLLMFAFLALAIGGIVFLVREFGRPAEVMVARSAGIKTAMDVLKERFAKGEIDSREFEEKRRVIEH